MNPKQQEYDQAASSGNNGGQAGEQSPSPGNQTGADNDRESGPAPVSGEAAAAGAPAETVDSEQTITVKASEWQSLQDALKQQQEQVLRIQAEADNRRKREQRQLERQRMLALESIMRQLLEVRDSMEMGLEACEAAAGRGAGEHDRENRLEALRDGMRMTLKLLDKTMQENHAAIIHPLGEPFDPELHEAISMLPDADQPRDTVVEVVQKGCRLHDRLLRPAKVVVSAGSGLK